ncbi:TPA: hypothetical protein ACF26F_005513, partial [Klebsiella quasipneumoniae subsp. similipneumoniae]
RSLYRQPRAYDCRTEQISVTLLLKERLRALFLFPFRQKTATIPHRREKNVAVLTFPFFS